MQIVVDLKDKASKQLTGINKKFGGMVAAINPVALAVTAVAASFAAIGGVAAVSINAFRGFEEGMAGVAKTTGMSGDALAELGDGIKGMAKEIPLAHSELADIAATAGQLGISGSDSILAFTKTVAEVATAFDITAEKAATSMGIMANIYDLPIDKISNLGSAINVMGNTTAASESQVLSFMTNLGASGVSLGFTSDQAAAMGATLVSMGQEGSDAGTRMKAAFTKMAQNIDKISGFLGITEEEFKKAFGKDPMKMIQRIIGELNKIEDPLEKDAAAADLFGQVGAKAMSTLAGGADMLTDNLENSAKGFEENTSLSEEFAAKTGTLNASFQILKNHLSGVAIGLGEKLAPYVKILVDKFIELTPIIED
ncbi:MAG: phage tail tape measure protein, partial [Gammaproteobacteria bacterium]|nr:phage tail tape measure protein [Gammaproteobacteria bacterium]